jgi:aryl-alcohol dehydrogenase-like predicted oxidoreductase
MEADVRYRLLGSSGLRISEFALGTMTFGEPRSWASLAGGPLTPATNASAPIRHRLPDFFRGGSVRRL